MKYIDSNVLIYGTLDNSEKGEWCRDLLRKIEKGEEKGGSSFLTYDEVFWKVNKSTSKEDALEATETILTMPNLRFFEVNSEIIWESHRIIKERGFDPRDAIHASTAIVHGIFTIVTKDSDFDDLTELNREWIK
ncbi:MAG: type II toxin-antitoxin system VapC family toxin [Thermoplasmatota archaeon]